MDTNLEEPDTEQYTGIHLAGRIRDTNPVVMTSDARTATHGVLMPRVMHPNRTDQQAQHYQWNNHTIIGEQHSREHPTPQRYSPRPRYPHDERDDHDSIPYTIHEPYQPTADDIDTIWSFSNHIFKGDEEGRPVPNIDRQTHNQHLNRHLDYLISRGTPPGRGIMEMWILCAGYTRTFHAVINRQGNSSLTPDSWKHVYEARTWHNSKLGDSTKIARHLMPPHLVIQLLHLPQPTQLRIRRDLCVHAMHRRKEATDSEKDEMYPVLSAFERQIKKELRDLLRNNLAYENSRHGIGDPPHVISAQDIAVQNICQHINPNTTSTEWQQVPDNNAHDEIYISNPEIPHLILPGYLTANLRMIPREHFNVIYEIACTPINTTGTNTNPKGNITFSEKLDPAYDSDIIIPRIREQLHRYLIRKTMGITPNTAQAMQYHKTGAGLGSLPTDSEASTDQTSPNHDIRVCPSCSTQRAHYVNTDEPPSKRHKPPPCPLCKCKLAPIPIEHSTPHTDWHTPHGTWRLVVPESQPPHYIFIPPSGEPLTKSETEDMIMRLGVESQFNHTTATIPSQQHVPLQTSNSTTWADLGVQPTPPWYTHNESPPPPAQMEFHPTMHTLHVLQERVNQTGAITEESQIKASTAHLEIPRNVAELLESEDITTRTWAQLMINHLRSNKKYLESTKRIRREHHLENNTAKRIRQYHNLRIATPTPETMPPNQAPTPTRLITANPTAARDLDLGATLRLQGETPITEPPNIHHLINNLAKQHHHTGSYGFPALQDGHGTVDTQEKAVDVVINLLKFFKAQIRATRTWWIRIYRDFTEDDHTPEHFTDKDNIDNLEHTIVNPPNHNDLKTWVQHSDISPIYVPEAQAWHTLYGIDGEGRVYKREGHFWTLSTWLSDVGGTYSLSDTIKRWYGMPVIAQYIKDRGHQLVRDCIRRNARSKKTLLTHLSKANLLPQSRYMRHVASEALKEYIIHDLYIRDKIDTDGFTLANLPDLPDADEPAENRGEAQRADHDERDATQLVILPLTHRRLLYPMLTDSQLEDATIHVPTEHHYRCPRRVSMNYKGRLLTLPCGRIKRNTTSWIHYYSQRRRGRRHIWMCDTCCQDWSRDWPGTRMTTLRSPYHTIQYITNEPDQHVQHSRAKHLMNYYRKFEGPKPRRDVENFVDTPATTTRFDLTNADWQWLTDALYRPPATSSLADWIQSVMTLTPDVADKIPNED